MQDTIERHNCIKVNTIFNGEQVVNVPIKVLILKIINSFKHRTCVSGTSGMSSNPHWHLSRSFKKFHPRDSGWALSRILNLTININKCNPMRVGCRSKEIMTKRAVINV